MNRAELHILIRQHLGHYLEAGDTRWMLCYDVMPGTFYWQDQNSDMQFWATPLYEDDAGIPIDLQNENGSIQSGHISQTPQSFPEYVALVEAAINTVFEVLETLKK